MQTKHKSEKNNKSKSSKENVAINIGISDKNAASSAMVLNILLSDEHVLYTKTRNFHWNVQGMQFGQLHQLFENQYTQLEEIIDDVAERVRQLGHFPLGSLSAFLSMTNLLESEDDSEDAISMLHSLVNDHETIIRVIRENIEKIESFKDFGTTDFITGLMEKHEKMAWMLRSHLG